MRLSSTSGAASIRASSASRANGQVEWYDLDLPDVIELRRKLVGGEGARYHFLACSVLESAWLDTVSAHRQRPFLFLAEGVFMYFEEAQVKSLVLTLREHFPGAELVFDAFSPFMRWAHNLRVTRTRSRRPPALGPETRPRPRTMERASPRRRHPPAR